MKLNEARQIQDKNNLGKRIIIWEVPAELRRNKLVKNGKTLIGINKWYNNNDIFVCIAKGDELIYIEKPLWLEISTMLKKIN